MRTILLGIAAIFIAVSVAIAGDYEDGVAAAKRGDYETALQIFRPLADQGDAGAQYNLGVLYGNGQGVPQDHAEAVKWYRKAVDQGDAGAQTNLGVLYANGQGVAQDYVYAHMWFNLSAARGNTKALNNRDITEKRMTREQIAEAQRLAREWKPSN